VEGIVWNRRYNIISIKNIIIKVYNIGNITAYCGISAVQYCITRCRGWYSGNQGCLPASQRIYVDIKVSRGITVDLC